MQQKETKNAFFSNNTECENDQLDAEARVRSEIGNDEKQNGKLCCWVLHSLESSFPFTFMHVSRLQRKSFQIDSFHILLSCLLMVDTLFLFVLPPSGLHLA